MTSDAAEQLEVRPFFDDKSLPDLLLDSREPANFNVSMVQGSRACLFLEGI